MGFFSASTVSRKTLGGVSRGGGQALPLLSPDGLGVVRLERRLVQLRRLRAGQRTHKETNVPRMSSQLDLIRFVKSRTSWTCIYTSLPPSLSPSLPPSLIGFCLYC